MKCSKCDKEAVFHYQSNINGEKSEYHLCADCAKEEGFGEMLEFKPASIFGSFNRDPFGSFFRDFWNEPFGMLSDGFFGRNMLSAPTMTAPEVNVKVGSEPETANTAEEKTDNIPKDAGGEFRAKRELHVLRSQLRAAVRAEEYEKAAELRDKIRAIEK